jgi:hypothetical protein
MEKERAAFLEAAGEMYDEVRRWREGNPGASLDEIVAQVRPRGRELMGELVAKLALQAGSGEVAEGLVCAECGERMGNKGKGKRTVLHGEGNSRLNRAHYYCARCGSGIFLLDKELKLKKHSWTPATMEQAVRLGVEIASYERAAAVFTDISGVSLGKSSLQQLVQEYGGQLVEKQVAEAEAMVKPPAQGEVEIEWRKIPQPTSETMRLSHDGVMLNLRDEGRKEVKIVTVSAVEQKANPSTGEVEVQLSQQSYRAGLWDAAAFTNQQWAESAPRGRPRGIPKAKRLACVADGAAWIWQLVLMCFSPCFEILDWWHAAQRLWTIANATFDSALHAAAWVEQQPRLWATGDLRTFFHNLRLLYPRGQTLPDPVRQAIFYLFRQRQRMRYAYFRHLDLPIGSRAVESACKVVLQVRMTQAGMRWSRNGAQAMLALPCSLLSDRWQQTWRSLQTP